jgi:Fur family ferric uptake transcriptional regulator
VGVATIYRVLSQFEESGIVQKLNFENNQAVYELCGLEHHDHLVCVKCNKIVEFQDDVIEKHQIQIAKKHSFELTDHSLYLYGLCKDCS